jgi:cell fate (sporulation/competence/biofilm development) regulator YmcA (YheA/YmcA/DUF963 family)
MELSIRNTQSVDFFKKREEKNHALQEARKRLEEHKKQSAETLYPSSIYESSSLMYSCEYIQLLENVIQAKTSLEIMDMVLDGLIRERIKILEDICS